jgi:hypothetical protein
VDWVLLDVMRRAGSPWRGEYGGVVACPGEQRLNGGRRLSVGEGRRGSCYRRRASLAGGASDPAGQA